MVSHFTDPKYLLTEVTTLLLITSKFYKSQWNWNILLLKIKLPLEALNFRQGTSKINLAAVDVDDLDADGAKATTVALQILDLVAHEPEKETEELTWWWPQNYIQFKITRVAQRFNGTLSLGSLENCFIFSHQKLSITLQVIQCGPLITVI